MTHTDQEILEAHVRSARVTLEQTSKEGREFSPMVLALRGPKAVAMIIPPDGDGQQIANTARLAAHGFAADMVLIVSDSYMATTQDNINPITGRTWDHGDMERMVQDHHGLERGLVTECLVISALRRSKPNHFRALRYRREEDGSITWLQEQEYDGWEELSGGRFAHVFAPGDQPLINYLRGINSQEEVDQIACRMLMDPKLGGCNEVMLLQ